MKNQFRIQVRETGEVLCYFETLEEVLYQLAKWQKEQAYNPDFYEIAELTLDGTYKPVES